MTVIPLGVEGRDPLDDFNDLYADVKSASDHEIEMAVGAVKAPTLPCRGAHPVIAQFPEMSGENYKTLLEDIAENGQQKVICLYQGMIWDGRARYDACVELRIVPRVWALRGIDPILYLLHRDNRKYGEPETPERRAALRILGQINSVEWRTKAAHQRTEWLADARLAFQRSYRTPQPCAVCGLSSEYSHAHHSLPLSLQFDLGVDEPIQTHDWLCPVHHKMIHRRIADELLAIGRRFSREYLFRHASEDARQAAIARLDVLVQKARTIFQQVGGVSPHGNWGMFRP